jgi:hypothetical protein
MRWTVILAVGLALVVAPAALARPGGGGGGKHGGLELRVVSSDARLVSGGDALVEVRLPARARMSDLRVRLQAGWDNRDVTAAFARRSNGRVLGLVSGLRIGKNRLQASLSRRGDRRGRDGKARISLTNHPIGGPVFSGRQVQPWVCMTVQNGLGPAQDAQCNAPTKVEYFYRSTNPATPGFLPYDPASPPTDVRTTTTDEGVTVPFVVRRERGTVNRYVYDIAVLATPGEQTSPWRSPRGWNGKLYYLYQGGALPQHKQGAPPNVFHELALSRGFAAATSSGNVFGTNTNTVTSAEVTMMVKERVIETLGEIRYTLAQGSSGGSMQQHLIANAYPGLLDGIQPSASYQDIHTTNNEVQDCSLLLRYFATTSLWADVTQRNAVLENANEQPGTCVAWSTASYHLDRAWMDPTSASCLAPGGVGLGTPQPWMYHPMSNPTGARCTLHDYQVAMFGKRQDGFANRPYDNVGIQYGLRALEAGKITPEQFVHLNEHVGGRDIDWNWTPRRSVADHFALEVAYRSGQVNLGNGLASVPVIDGRSCRNLEIHSCYHSWVMRQRLEKTNGHADNHVILARADTDTASAVPLTTASFDLLDRWVAAIKADRSKAPLAVKVRRHRPADAVDACWINGVRTTDAAACAAVTPYFGEPRTGAGAPLSVDVMKCQTTPLKRSRYSVSFTDAQWERLRAAFPTGVCDWSKRSVGYERPVAWLSYANGPGGKPIRPAPTSD